MLPTPSALKHRIYLPRLIRSDDALTRAGTTDEEAEDGMIITRAKKVTAFVCTETKDEAEVRRYFPGVGYSYRVVSHTIMYK